jgi:hypothetical protein
LKFVSRSEDIRTDPSQLEESLVVAEYQMSDCRGCGWQFLSLNQDHRPLKAGPRPPDSSLVLFSCVSTLAYVGITVNAYILVTQLPYPPPELGQIVDACFFQAV